MRTQVQNMQARVHTKKADSHTAQRPHTQVLPLLIWEEGQPAGSPEHPAREVTLRRCRTLIEVV